MATFLVKFDAPPAVTVAAIKKEVGKYKVDKISMKLTGKPALKGADWSLGAVALTGDMTAKLAELKGKLVVVSGALTEDDKGKQSIALSSVDEVKKK